jgi:hypothetical protein
MICLIYQEVKWIITKVVEIKEFLIIKLLTEGNGKDVNGLEPLFMTSIMFFAFDVNLSVDSNDALFAIFSDNFKK